METFRVAAVQMNALVDEVDHNLEVHRRFTAEAAEAGCRLVVFPELGTTAHFGDVEALKHAEPAGGGGVFAFMSALASRHDLVISYGFCEEAHGTFYNTQALVGPGGLIGVQRKVHASWDEYFYFRMGRSLDVFDLGFATVGTLVCFDSAFFEAWRVLALKGAEVLLLPHAARIARGQELPDEEILERLRGNRRSPKKESVFAQDNGVFVVHANQVGYNGHSTHGGGVHVIAPDGTVLVEAEPTTDDIMITAELNVEALKAARDRNAVMRLRRGELYGELTGPL
jgi:predicted amidohydrolase